MRRVAYLGQSQSVRRLPKGHPGQMRFWSPRSVAVTAAAAVGFLLTCAVFHPAVMSSDSLYMYREAVTGVIEAGGKPPLAAYLWMWVLKIERSPFSLMVFQNLIFWIGLALLVAGCAIGPIRSAVAVLAIGLWPPVFALLGALWTDVLLGASLMLVVGLAAVGARRRSRLMLGMAFVPLWCALAMRLNALPAVLPLTAWLIVLWHNVGARRSPGVRATIVTSMLVIGGFMLSLRVFNRVVTEPGPNPARRSLQFALLHDLAGIAAATGDMRFPSRVRRSVPDLDISEIRRLYHPADVTRLVYDNKQDASAFVTTDPAEFNELVRVWAGAISAHPGAYLRRRADALAAVLQIPEVFYPFHVGIDANNLGVEFAPRPLYDRALHWLRVTSGVTFRGWVYCLVGLMIVIAGVRRGRWGSVAVGVSGLLYVAPYTVISTGADFRFIWWQVVSTLLAGFMLLAKPIQGSSIPTGPEPDVVRRAPN